LIVITIPSFKKMSRFCICYWRIVNLSIKTSAFIIIVMINYLNSETGFKLFFKSRVEALTLPKAPILVSGKFFVCLTKLVIIRTRINPPKIVYILLHR